MILRLFLLFNILFASCTLKDQLFKAQKGDFVVTLQNKIYSVYVINDFKENSLIFSEISIPQATIKPQNFNWKNWIEKKFPGKISWNIYKLNLSDSKILKIYSVEQNKYFVPSTNDFFFIKLLNLKLLDIEKGQEKKIGPEPPTGEPDHRPIWYPRFNKNGKLVKNSNFKIYYSNWPSDNSPLSGKRLELYFSDFFFPIHIQFLTTHLEIILKTIEIGNGVLIDNKILNALNF